MPFFFDPTMVLILPAIILALWANSKVKNNYAKFSKYRNIIGLTGREVARKILDTNGLYNIDIEAVQGQMTDHYDPKKGVVRLSEGVYNNSSVSAMAIAAHEVGHALQHAQGYKPLKIRHSIFPLARLGSNAAFPLFLLGFLFSAPFLMNLGIIFFAGALAFQLVTLPVEFNASKRAFQQLDGSMVIDPKEMSGVKKVLNAAALTYVASALMALLQLIRLLVLRNARD
jgi:Zn-dependent membrane protease YugP